MKNHVITVVALLFILALGCGKKQDTIVNSDSANPQPSSPSIDVIRLLDNYSAGQEFDVAEIMTAPSGSDNYINDSIYDVYIVTFLWGRLTNAAPIVNVPTVWDGALHINGPSIVNTLHTIDFENAEDSIIREDEPWSESWGSTTDNEFDGAVFLLLYDKVTPTFAPQVLTFETEPIILQFDFHELIHLYAFYQVDHENSVAIYAHKIRPSNCREGYFEGDWKKGNNTGSDGTFEGHWFTHSSDTVGAVHGAFWTTNDGSRLMEGNISRLHTNEIIGHLHGVWEHDDYRLCPLCGSGHGNFKGRFQLANNDHNGYFRGEFGDYSLPPDDSIMPFYGKWKMNCVTLADSDFSNDD